MNIKTYLQELSPDEKIKFADKAGTSTAYLSQLVSGHRKAGLKAIAGIERASDGKITANDLRADIYGAPPDVVEPPCSATGT